MVRGQDLEICGVDYEVQGVGASKMSGPFLRSCFVRLILFV